MHTHVLNAGKTDIFTKDQLIVCLKMICTRRNCHAFESRGRILFSLVIQLKGKRAVLYIDWE